MNLLPRHDRCTEHVNRGFLYEVIVSDDGHTDTAEKMIRSRFGWVKWVPGPHRGPAANRNNGAKHAAGDWLVFTDDDCLPDPGWLFAFARAVSTSEAKALEGSIHPIGDPSADLVECPSNLDGGHFWSANIAVRTDIFLKTGKFDENFAHAAQEDQDLYLRLGGSSAVPFVVEAIVRHPIRPFRLMAKLRAAPTAFKDWIYYMRKHTPKRSLTVWRIQAIVIRLNAPGIRRNLLKGRFGCAMVNIYNIILSVVLTSSFLKSATRRAACPAMDDLRPEKIGT